MTRSVYVTGIDRGDGRQVVELGVMELLTRHVDRVGVFRPLIHDDGPDRLFDLLRARYRLTQSPDTVYGLRYEEAAALQAERGTDELVSRLVDRFHAVARDYEYVLVLGSDYSATSLPAELNLNARLANEFGAAVLAVVGGQGQEAESVRAEARNAYQAYHSLGCDVVAMVVNRVAPSTARRSSTGSPPGSRCPATRSPRTARSPRRPSARSCTPSVPRCCSATIRAWPGTPGTSSSAAPCCRPSSRR